MPSRMVSLVTPREVAPPLFPAKARHGGEYGSLGICLARSEHGVTAPSGSAAAAPPSARSIPAFICDTRPSKMNAGPHPPRRPPDGRHRAFGGDSRGEEGHGQDQRHEGDERPVAPEQGVLGARQRRPRPRRRLRRAVASTGAGRHGCTPSIERRRVRHQSPPKSARAKARAPSDATVGAPLEQPDTRPRLVLSHLRVAGRTATGPLAGGATGAASSAVGGGAATGAGPDPNAGNRPRRSSKDTAGTAGRTRTAGADTGATVGNPGAIRPKGSP